MIKKLELLQKSLPEAKVTELIDSFEVTTSEVYIRIHTKSHVVERLAREGSQKTGGHVSKIYNVIASSIGTLRSGVINDGPGRSFWSKLIPSEENVKVMFSDGGFELRSLHKGVFKSCLFRKLIQLSRKIYFHGC